MVIENIRPRRWKGRTGIHWMSCLQTLLSEKYYCLEGHVTKVHQQRRVIALERVGWDIR